MRRAHGSLVCNTAALETLRSGLYLHCLKVLSGPGTLREPSCWVTPVTGQEAKAQGGGLIFQHCRWILYHLSHKGSWPHFSKVIKPWAFVWLMAPSEHPHGHSKYERNSHLRRPDRPCSDLILKSEQLLSHLCQVPWLPACLLDKLLLRVSWLPRVYPGRLLS